jgi:hypothetical protein
LLRGRIQYGRGWMRAETPDAGVGELRQLVLRSPLLPDPALRRYWLRVLGWLPEAAQRELMDILLPFDPR